MTVPDALGDFDIRNAGLTVWLFKKSGGMGGSPPIYNGHWIATNAQLDLALKEAVYEARDRIKETMEYGLLAQNNEASALLIDVVETNASLIVDQSGNPTPQKQVKSESHVANTLFFVVRLTDGDNVLHAIRKTDSSWRTKRRREMIDIVFRENALALDESPSFSLSKHIDFFIAGDQIIIPHKANFESVLHYRQAHTDEFDLLQAETDFSKIFSSLEPLTKFVGNNKIQLRRMCSIRQKGHYKDPDFMKRLQTKHKTYGLVLNFDDAGAIVPSPETCRDIITALLDHRLASAFSENIYDVPDATRIP
jgi:hypothetical protein